MSNATNIQGLSMCFDESLIVYLGVCLDEEFTLGCIKIVHIFRHDNWRELA